MKPIKVCVLTPTTGNPLLTRANQSVLNQKVPSGWEVDHIIVSDGARFQSDSQALLPDGQAIYTVPHNTNDWGGGRWYGHRLYAYYSQLLNADFILFLDEDNYYAPNHIQEVVSKANSYGIGWSRRAIVKGEELIGYDDFEAICDPEKVGYNLIDTSTWCFRRDFVHLAMGIVGEWGADRKLTKHVLVSLNEGHVRRACTLKYTVYYDAPDHLVNFFRAYCSLPNKNVLTSTG